MAGRPPKVTAEDVEAILLQADDPVLSSGEIAAELDDVAQKTVETRLRELHDDGLIRGKKIGHSWAWWHPEKVVVHDANELDGDN